jgi:hypothetical protein
MILVLWDIFILKIISRHLKMFEIENIFISKWLKIVSRSSQDRLKISNINYEKYEKYEL